MNNRRKALLEIALVFFILAMIIMAWGAAINAEKAPDAPTPHCELLTNDDTCYILVHPGRSVTMEQNGDAWVFTLTGLPTEGE